MVSTPNDLPSVGTEDARAMANYTFTIVADSGYESTTEGRCSAKQYGAVIYALHNDASYVEQRDSLAAERDELASRVRELEGALRNILNSVPCSDGNGFFIVERHTMDGEYAGTEHIDPMWVVNEMAGIANAALNASKEQP